MDEQILSEVAKEYGFSSLEEFTNAPEVVKDTLIRLYTEKQLKKELEQVLELNREIQKLKKETEELTIAMKVIQGIE